MRLRPLCVVVLILLLVPTAARAHGHVWDVAFGPTSAQGSSLWGARVSLGVTNKVPTNKNLSWLVDISDFRDGKRDITQFSQLGGPRYVLLDTPKQTLSLHVLSGIVHTDRGATSNTSVPVTVGGSYEWVPRGATAGFAMRVQVDRSFVPEKNVKGYWQVSAGLVHLFD